MCPNVPDYRLETFLEPKLYGIFSFRKESSFPGIKRLFMGKQLQYQVQLLHFAVAP